MCRARGPPGQVSALELLLTYCFFCLFEGG